MNIWFSFVCLTVHFFQSTVFPVVAQYSSETALSLSELNGVRSQKTALFSVTNVTNPPSVFLDMFFPMFVLIIQFILLYNCYCKF
jgi:hypothetical protein